MPFLNRVEQCTFLRKSYTFAIGIGCGCALAELPQGQACDAQDSPAADEVQRNQ